MNHIMEKAKYEGYVWYCDQSVPQVLDGSEYFVPNLVAEENPFIVEAQLYDASQGKSYSIRYWDGKYHVACHEVPVNVRERYAADIVAYESNRMNNRDLLFWQQWMGKEDSLCLGMKTLVPKALVFVGFEK